MASTKKLLICTFVILAISFVIGLLPVHGESEIYDTVVRLHVLANSDSDEDQSLKLKVRDRIIEVVSDALDGIKDRDEAIAAINAELDSIESAAREVIESEGYDYDVSVELGEEYYPTKSYESCAFPEGKYTSLRVMIGESEGQNWWCCLFPPLCLSAATDDAKKSNEEAFIAVGLNSEQYKLITESNSPKYKVRFKILEAFSGLFK